MSHIVIGCDTETTGLMPAEKNFVVELGLAAILVPEFEIVETWSTPILHDMKEVAMRCDAFVWEMHKTSGLIEELRQMNVGERPAVTPKQALLEALAFVNRYSQRFELDERGRPMCIPLGANPDFDRRYLEVWMPDLAKKFHYRSFDVNTLFALRRWVFGGPVVKLGQKHRTTDDIIQAVQGVHEFFNAFAAGYQQRIDELEAQIAEMRATHQADLAVQDALAGVPG